MSPGRRRRVETGRDAHFAALDLCKGGHLAGAEQLGALHHDGVAAHAGWSVSTGRVTAPHGTHVATAVTVSPLAYVATNEFLATSPSTCTLSNVGWLPLEQ